MVGIWSESGHPVGSPYGTGHPRDVRISVAGRGFRPNSDHVTMQPPAGISIFLIFSAIFDFFTFFEFSEVFSLLGEIVLVLVVWWCRGCRLPCRGCPARQAPPTLQSTQGLCRRPGVHCNVVGIWSECEKKESAENGLRWIFFESTKIQKSCTNFKIVDISRF